jgi:hypothetical protein
VDKRKLSKVLEYQEIEMSTSHEERTLADQFDEIFLDDV